MLNVQVVGGKTHLVGPHTNGSQLFCGMPNLGNVVSTAAPVNCWNCYDGAGEIALYGRRVSVDYGFAREDFIVFTGAVIEKLEIANMINSLHSRRPLVSPEHINVIGDVKLAHTVAEVIPNGIRY